MFSWFVSCFGAAPVVATPVAALEAAPVVTPVVATPVVATSVEPVVMPVAALAVKLTQKQFNAIRAEWLRAAEYAVATASKAHAAGRWDIVVASVAASKAARDVAQITIDEYPTLYASRAQHAILAAERAAAAATAATAATI